MTLASKTNSLMLALALMLSGCSKSGAQSSPATDDPSTPPDTNIPKILETYLGIPYAPYGMKQATLDKMLAGWNESCEQASGKPLSKNLTCDCPSGKIFSARQRSCVNLDEPPTIPGKKTFKDCAAEGFQTILSQENGQEKFRSCLARPIKSRANSIADGSEDGMIFTHLKLLEPEDMSSAAKLAALLDDKVAKEGKVEFKALVPAAYRNMSRIRFYIGAGDGAKLFDSTPDSMYDILYTDYYYDETTGKRASYKKIYEPEVAMLPFVTGAVPKDQIPKEMYPRYEGSDKALRYLDSGWRSLSARGFKPMYFQPMSGLGCEELCRVFSRPFNVDLGDGEYNYITERIYSGGAILTENVWMFNDRMIPVGAVAIGFNGKPVYFVDLSYQYQDGSLSRSAKFYDRAYRKLHESSAMLEEDLPAAVEKTSAMAGVSSVGAGQGVILCERLLPESQSWAIKGPHSLTKDSLKGSIYGWYENAAASPFLALAGYKSYQFSAKGTDFAPRVGHGDNVAKLIVAGFPNAKIAPAGYCLFKSSATPGVLRYAKLDQGVTGQRFKVANYSFFLPGRGKAECQQRFVETYRDHGDRLLHVIGAGNDGHTNPAACPQSLKGYHSLIVAGAENADTATPTMWAKSNRGEDFADIAASPYTLDGSQDGTSFSAPRVSGTAAKIGSEAPHLLAKDIRLAILVSAHIPEQKLPVRSGGVLRSERAMQVAKCFHDDATIGRQQGKTAAITAAQAERCLASTDDFDPAAAKRQIAFLASRPLIFE